MFHYQVQVVPPYRAALVHSIEVSAAEKKRNVPLAFGLSAVVPGAGQGYNNNWIKAAVAVGAEVAVLWAWSSWRSKGIAGRDEYQATAHTHWSPVRYALWLNDYVSYLNGLPDGRRIDAELIAVNTELLELDIANPDAWTDVQQLAVRHLILDIRHLETLVYHPETGASFSHQLPFFGEQQYYELVGKYFQFAPGWDDYYFLVRNGLATWIDEGGNFIASIDPEHTAADGSKPHVSSRFFAYAERHADSNNYLRRASRVSIAFFVNHLLAAADAAISARMHNNRLQTQLAVSQNEWVFALKLHF